MTDYSAEAVALDLEKMRQLHWTAQDYQQRIDSMKDFSDDEIAKKFVAQFFR